ncbi:MAG: hypothetical protein ACRD2L_16645, partial [Terriglobia bacterium]
FWGLLHPLLLAGLFSITGSVDILIPRLLSLVSGSLVILMLFYLARRYFNLQVALAAAIFASLSPVGLLGDVSGMQEPIGMLMFFAGLWLWPKRASAAGALFAAAGTLRAEYWVFGAGLVAVALLIEDSGSRKWGVLLGWLIPTLAYARYLTIHTGNPVYPIYWNFVGNAVGEWIVRTPFNSTQILVMWVFRSLLPVFAVAAWLVIHKRSKYALFYLLGLGNILFLCLVLGFSAYMRSFILRVLVDRTFQLPYMYLGLFLSVAIFHWMPRLRRTRLLIVGSWFVCFALVALYQLAWAPIFEYHNPWSPFWKGQFAAASDIAKFYEGGTVSIPEDRPDFTYLLVRYHGLEARSIE